MKFKNTIFVYGGGGHAKVVLDTITRTYGAESIAGIFDDDLAKANTKFYEHQIIGPPVAGQIKNGTLIIAIGHNKTRAEKVAILARLNVKYITVIDPTAIITSSVKIGAGTLVMPGAILNADARVGDHCIINTSAIVEHDCQIGNFAHIAPGVVLTGAVSVGSTTLVGANSVIVPGKKIGANCLVAAGSVVTKDIPDNCMVRGNPARIIRKFKE